MLVYNMIFSAFESKIGIVIAIFSFYYMYSYLLASFGEIFLGQPIKSYFSFFNRHIIESISFFLGVLISSFLIVCLSYLIGLKLSFYFLILLVIAILVSKGKFRTLFYFNYKNLVIAVFIVIFQLFIALIPLPSFFASLSLENFNPFDGFGAIVHSLRSGNISLYLLESNSVPRVNQNIGQSLITTYPMFLLGKFPQINLIVWKGFILFNSLRLIYGLLINFTSNTRFNFIVLTGILFGQTGLGLTYIQTVDTGSTLFFLANTDTYVSVFSFFIFYLVALYEMKVPNIFHRILLVLMGISWNFFGAQNILLTVIVFGGFFLFYKKFNLGLFLTFFVSSLSLGYIFGGLFAVDSKVPSSSIPGLMSVMNGGDLIEFRYPVLSSFSHFEFYTVCKNCIPYLETLGYYEILLILISSFFSVFIGLIFIYYLINILRLRNVVDELYFTYIFLFITLISFFIIIKGLWSSLGAFKILLYWKLFYDIFSLFCFCKYEFTEEKINIISKDVVFFFGRPRTMFFIFFHV